MKRDMELVRQLLLRVESYSNDAMPPIYEKDKNELWHISILMEGGYVTGEIQKDDYGIVLWARPIYLTWKGCELLDAIRDKNVWTRTKSSITGKIASVSMSVLTDIATVVTKNMLGMV